MGKQRNQPSFLRAEEPAVINHQLVRLHFRHHIRIVVGFVLNKGDAPDAGQINCRNEIDQRPGQRQTIGCSANANAPTVCQNRTISGQFIQFRARVNSKKRQLFLYTQLLFIAGKRQLRIVFPCNFQEQIAHIALKEFRI